ncbi:hypothetical protein L1987_44488 [Smallanthus sonchifolius]|uniref:Uncharacterized protein n=1 Tax=Smallanthus sonchifolius TaxID=185202 RepID=A0ACB9GPF9_9ASTR|nr:hypothetical protein L1987_44488 [Smallanthus sonchifolius]
MRNVLAIGLVLTSLFAAAVWSPSPTQHDQDHREMIVKEGHRVVVVEYDKEADGSTKVLISPHDVAPSEVDSKDTSNKDKPAEGKFSGPRELVCDAYGKCKHKIASALEKTRHKVEETVDEVSDKAREIEKNAKETKDRLSEKVLEKDTGHTVGESLGKAKESVFHGIDKAKEVAEDVVGTVKDSVVKIDAMAGLVHMLGFSTAYGMCVWVTFISSYILGRHLTKQQFGVVQSRIYPVYFKAMAYCVSAALFGYLASRKYGILRRSMIRFQCLSLFSALLMVLTNMILLEPRATKTMYERMKIEKEEGRGVAVPTRDGVVDHSDATVMRPHANVVEERQDVLKLNEKLKRLNSYSSALNISTLVALTWHMAYMGTRVHASRKKNERLTRAAKPSTEKKAQGRCTCTKRRNGTGHNWLVFV